MGVPLPPRNSRKETVEWVITQLGRISGLGMIGLTMALVATGSQSPVLPLLVSGGVALLTVGEAVERLAKARKGNSD